MKKQLCSADDCYNEIDLEWDAVKKPDGTFHPLSLKCEDCISNVERNTLKNYRKKLRHKANKKKENYEYKPLPAFKT